MTNKYQIPMSKMPGTDISSQFIRWGFIIRWGFLEI
jgi:hypothetical protein